MCKCPTIGDLFCSLFNCFSCRENKCEHKPEPRCEKRFECVCQEQKHEDNRHENNCCACQVK